MNIKKFNQFLNEGHNLKTLKSYIDTGNKLWVRVDPNVDYPGRESDHEELEVKDIDVKGIHDGTISVESPSGEQIFIQHDDIVKTIDVLSHYVNEDLTLNENIYPRTLGLADIRKYIKNNLSIEVDELIGVDGFEIKLLLKDEVISSGEWMNK